MSRTNGGRWTPTTPIVVFGDDWGRHVSTMQHLFRHIAATHPVVWVNAIGHRLPSLRADGKRVWQKLRGMVGGGEAAPSSEITAGTPPCHIIQPRVLPWHHIGIVHAVNTWSLVRDIQSALARLGMTEPPLLVTGTPPSCGVVGRLGEIGSVYFCMDDFLHLPNVSPGMLGPLEQRLLERVDVVVATARALTESKRPRSGTVFYLPQGVNFEHFSMPQAEPADVARLAKPRIGFAGGLTTPFDVALVRRIAESSPAASIVLVGPVRMDLSALSLPNVHVLGPRPYRDLPAYVQAFDVGLIPYVLNEHTVAVDPLKLLEYLAAGVPVVSTDLPEVRKYSKDVSIAATHDAFVQAVGSALDQPPEMVEQRQAAAREHGWDRRAAELVRIFAQTGNSGGT